MNAIAGWKRLFVSMARQVGVTRRFAFDVRSKGVSLYLALNDRQGGFCHTPVAFSLHGPKSDAQNAATSGNLGRGPDEPPLTLDPEEHRSGKIILGAAHIAAGGTLLRSADEPPHGGFRGYVADPDGHAWGIAWNPAWPIDANGHVSFAT
jgi:hypothetical protein